MGDITQPDPDATGIHTASRRGVLGDLPDFEARFGEVKQAKEFKHEGENVSIAVKILDVRKFLHMTEILKVYAMLKKVRGQCLIVNNEKFDNGEERKGSAMDAANLEFLFGKLAFQVSN